MEKIGRPEIRQVNSYMHFSKAALEKEAAWIFAALKSNIAS